MGSTHFQSIQSNTRKEAIFSEKNQYLHLLVSTYV